MPLSLLEPFTPTLPQGAAVTEEELLAPFASLSEQPPPEVLSFLLTVHRGDIPEEIPEALMKRSSYLYLVRSALQRRGYYAHATADFADTVAAVLRREPILDPLAGVGFMAKAFREAGIPTIATDDGSWDFESPTGEKLDALASLDRYAHEVTTVLISWAPPRDAIDLAIWERIQERYPHLGVLTIGEGRFGCTGSQAFGEVLTSGHWEELPYTTTAGLRDHCLYHPAQDELYA